MLSQLVHTKDDEFRETYESIRIRELTAELDRLKVELKREQALRERQERYRELFENANDIMYTQNFDGQFIFCNKAAERLTGYSREELKGMHMNDLIAPEYLPLCETMIRQKLQSGGSTSYEAEIITKDGQRLPLEISTRLIYEGNQPIAIQGTSRDIRARREMEQKLKESEARLRQIMDNMHDLIGYIDTQGMVQYICTSIRRILEYDPENVVGKSALLIVHPDDIELVKNNVFKGLQTGCWERMEVRLRHAQGHYLWFGTIGNSVIDDDGRIIGATLSCQEITDRKEAERRLQEQLEFLQLLIETIPSPIFYKDNNGRYRTFNQAFAEYVGMDREELLGKSVYETYPLEFAEIYAENDCKLLSHPGVQRYDAKYYHGDGSIREVTFNKATFMHQGEAAGLVGVITDITPLKQAERALADEKERLAVTLASIGEGVITTDREGRVTLMNRVAEQVTGWTQADAINRRFGEIFRLPDNQSENCQDGPLQTLMRANSPIKINEQRLLRKEGQEIIVSVSGAPIRDQQGKSIGTVMVVRDITDALKLEQELQKASKLESLGVLAGGIAHDFNNLMTVVLGNVTLTRALLGEDHEGSPLLAETEKAVMQARALTNQLLTFARGGQPVKKTIQLSSLIKDATGFALSGSNVRAEINLPDDLYAVEADSGQMAQVFNNLIINAQQAMPGGGTIKVNAENITIRKAQSTPLGDGRYVRVSVEDNGIGIPRENQTKIFDPYFTTKINGSGLGLSTAYSIVKGHDGYIEVDSIPNGGTVFRVYLPASTTIAPETEPKKEPAALGRGRILVMDDDVQILRTAQNMLNSLGYHVVLAADGEVAFNIYKEALTTGQQFDAVLMDLTIPGGMGGRETLQHLLKLDPQVNAIVSSGYSNDMVMTDYQKWGFKGIVPKPYTIKELSDALQQVIG